MCLKGYWKSMWEFLGRTQNAEASLMHLQQSIRMARPAQVKGKARPRKAMKAQRGSRGIALLVLQPRR